MARHFCVLLAALTIVGCELKPVGKQPVATNNGDPADAEIVKSNDPPAKPSPKPDPMKTPQTFTPSKDKELAALQDVPVADLIAKLTEAKQRDLAGRALVARGKDAVDPLVKTLDAEDAQVRAAAAFVLGQLGQDAEPAKAKLTKMSEDDQDDIARDAATFALDALETPDEPEK